MTTFGLIATFFILIVLASSPGDPLVVKVAELMLLLVLIWEIAVQFIKGKK